MGKALLAMKQQQATATLLRKKLTGRAADTNQCYILFAKAHPFPQFWLLFLPPCPFAECSCLTSDQPSPALQQRNELNHLVEYAKQNAPAPRATRGKQDTEKKAKSKRCDQHSVLSTSEDRLLQLRKNPHDVLTDFVLSNLQVWDQVAPFL